MNGITLEEIIREVPAVGAVLSAVPRVNDDKWCATYERYKQILKGLIGDFAPEYENEMLNTCWAYDAVNRALQDALDGALALPKPEEAGA